MKQTAPLEIGLSVNDLPAMVDFYTQVFGCEEVRRAEIPAELSTKIGVAENGYTNVWMRFPGGEIVKLVWAGKSPTAHAAVDYAAERAGLVYFTLYCDDILAAIDGAKAAGGAMVSDPSLVAPDAPVKLAFLTDLEGNLFEFVQA